MLCQNCGKNEATTHIKQIVNGDTTELHLCAECAEHLGYTDAFSGFGLDVSDFFGSFFGDAVHSLSSPKKVTRCPKCGYSFNDIVREGRVGCAECYHTFYNELRPSIQRIHGQVNHNGKVPSVAQSSSGISVRENEIQSLQVMMDQAISTQNFELAAEIRDRLKRFNGGESNG